MVQNSRKRQLAKARAARSYIQTKNSSKSSSYFQNKIDFLIDIISLNQFISDSENEPENALSSLDSEIEDGDLYLGMGYETPLGFHRVINLAMELKWTSENAGSFLRGVYSKDSRTTLWRKNQEASILEQHTSKYRKLDEWLGNSILR
jgi:hypothetical protein